MVTTSRESLVLKCNTHNLSTKGKNAELAARLKSFFEQNHHPAEPTQNAKDQDTSMADNDLPNSTPKPPQATSIPAASPIIQSIMPGIEELITKHLSQLSSSTSQSQPGSSKDPNYSNQSSKKDGANPARERTSSRKGRLECYMDWFPSLICKNYIFNHFVKTVQPASLKFCTILKLITLHLELTIAQVKCANFFNVRAQTFVLSNGEMATVSPCFRKLKFGCG